MKMVSVDAGRLGPTPTLTVFRTSDSIRSSFLEVMFFSLSAGRYFNVDSANAGAFTS